MDGPILSVRNLTKIFSRRGQPDVTAVNDATFEVRPGECLGIIGESGSGKSTVAHMITRLLEPTAGQIFLDGEEITRLRGAGRRRLYQKVQMVFQTPVESFDPRRTLGDGVGESLETAGMSAAAVREEVARLLAVCGLPAEFADRYPHQASGGECQRAAIARAIAIRPALLVCDEATSALDVTIQRDVIGLLARLRRELAMACLFICHDIALVQDFCDRVLVMHRGRIVERGTPDEVIRSPREEYTKMLIDSVL